MSECFLEPVSAAEADGVFAQAVLAGMPHSAMTAADVRKALSSGRMQGWKIGMREDDKTQLLAMGATEIVKSNGTSVLWLAALSYTKDLGVEVWRTLLDGLEEFAKSHGCVRIEAVTKSEEVVLIASSLGFDTDWRALSKEVANG